MKVHSQIIEIPTTFITVAEKLIRSTLQVLIPEVSMQGR